MNGDSHRQNDRIIREKIFWFMAGKLGKWRFAGDREEALGSRVVFWWNCHSRTRTTFVEDQIKAFGVRTKWVPSGGA